MDENTPESIILSYLFGIQKNKAKTIPINLPSSKSISNRLLILQEISGNTFEIENLSAADDTQILTKLLVKIDETTIFDCGEGGTTMRFLTAYLALRTQKKVTVTGSHRLQERPISILVDALRELGAQIEYLKNDGFAPFTIAPACLNKTNTLQIDGSVSSQYISALLLIAPALPEGLQIRVEKQNSVSSTYLKTTINTLQNVGYQAIIHNFETYEIFSVSAMNNENKSFLTQEKVLEVPADWSSATYFFSIAALLPPNISIELLHLKPNDAPQADEKIMEFAAPFLHISRTESGNFVLKQRTIFLETPNTIDCTECPDLAQTLAVLFAAKRKKVLLTGLKTLRIKETDRIFALASELAKIGVQTQTTADSLAITDFEKDFTIDFDTKTIHISTYNDHRMAMAFAPLALVLPRIGIENAGVVSKSFPHFWAEMRKLGIS